MVLEGSYFLQNECVQVMKIIEVEPIRTRRSTTLVDNEPCTDAAKDMAALTGISEVRTGECD